MAEYEADTDAMRDQAATLQKIGQRISEIVGQLASSAGSVSGSLYGGQLASQLRSFGSQANAKGESRQGEAASRASELRLKADEIDEVLGQVSTGLESAAVGVSGLLGVSGWMSAFGGLSLGLLEMAGKILSLAGLEGVVRTWVPGSSSPSPLSVTFGDLVTKNNEQVSGSLSPSVSPSQPSVTFGDLITRDNEQWWENKQNTKNQWDPRFIQAMGDIGLTGLKVNNACGPVSLAMVINYLNFRDGEHQATVDPVTLIGEAKPMFKKGEGKLSFANLAMLAQGEGFTVDPQPDPYAQLSTPDLLRGVAADNPAIAFVKATPWGTLDPGKDFDHFVVVTGVSQDQTKVTIVNPLPGGANKAVVPETISIDKFKSSWEFASGQGQAIFLHRQ